MAETVLNAGKILCTHVHRDIFTKCMYNMYILKFDYIYISFLHQVIVAIMIKV